ncbi:carbamoyltransferase [Nibricoccus sp. IMCC34717]|uniref:carbamoyltransferase family protein n=1 Tax=Nibricoccus sp. IMCC34717 TaxID=3034021 RepID=UPI00384D766E
MKILGLSAFYHDSAAALVVDGRVVAAAQEERFTRRKHDASFPEQAVQYCLREAGLRIEEIDQVVFYEKPLLKFERLVETWLAEAPRGFGAFLEALPQWLQRKLHHPRLIREGLGAGWRKRPVFVEHHESHAASAFFPSPFAEAAILTLDGVGEWTTTSWGVGRGNQIELHEEIHFPHSLGLLYSAFTYHCGFRVNSGEYKLMGLAPYGTPRHRELILRELVDVKEDGSYRLNLRLFGFTRSLRMTNPAFEKLFGPARRPEEPIKERHLDLAASIQAVTEEIVLRLARSVRARSGLRNLVLAGGVALNCVANGRVFREAGFDRLWIQPAAGDAGGALGAALFCHYQLLEAPRPAPTKDAMQGALLGPGWTDDGAARALTEAGAVFERVGEQALAGSVASLLAAGKIVAWVQGRMEFGPRALGNRSILGDPRDPEMQRRMNLRIKFRESFRPFAPAVLAGEVVDWFSVTQGFESPYMLVVAPVANHRRRVATESVSGLARQRQVLSEIPAVTHVDQSARIQTVDTKSNPRFSALLSAFAGLTGCPVLVNTSFNVRGEPIVCSPADAYRCFLATEMDVLVVGDCIVRREAQPAERLAAARGHERQFSAD